MQYCMSSTSSAAASSAATLLASGANQCAKSHRSSNSPPPFAPYSSTSHLPSFAAKSSAADANNAKPNNSEDRSSCFSFARDPPYLQNFSTPHNASSNKSYYNSRSFNDNDVNEFLPYRSSRQPSDLLYNHQEPNNSRNHFESRAQSNPVEFVPSISIDSTSVAVDVITLTDSCLSNGILPNSSPHNLKFRCRSIPSYLPNGNDTAPHLNGHLALETNRNDFSSSWENYNNTENNHWNYYQQSDLQKLQKPEAKQLGSSLSSFEISEYNSGTASSASSSALRNKNLHKAFPPIPVSKREQAAEQQKLFADCCTKSNNSAAAYTSNGSDYLKQQRPRTSSGLLTQNSNDNFCHSLQRQSLYNSFSSAVVPGVHKNSTTTSYSPDSTDLDAFLNEVEAEFMKFIDMHQQKRASEWKSSFMSVREKFDRETTDMKLGLSLMRSSSQSFISSSNSYTPVARTQLPEGLRDQVSASRPESPERDGHNNGLINGGPQSVFLLKSRSAQDIPNLARRNELAQNRGSAKGLTNGYGGPGHLYQDDNSRGEGPMRSGQKQRADIASFWMKAVTKPADLPARCSTDSRGKHSMERPQQQPHMNGFGDASNSSKHIDFCDLNSVVEETRSITRKTASSTRSMTNFDSAPSSKNGKPLQEPPLTVAGEHLPASVHQEVNKILEMADQEYHRLKAAAQQQGNSAASIKTGVRSQTGTLKQNGWADAPASSYGSPQKVPGPASFASTTTSASSRSASSVQVPAQSSHSINRASTTTTSIVSPQALVQNTTTAVYNGGSSTVKTSSSFQSQRTTKQREIDAHARQILSEVESFLQESTHQMSSVTTVDSSAPTTTGNQKFPVQVPTQTSNSSVISSSAKYFTVKTKGSDWVLPANEPMPSAAASHGNNNWSPRSLKPSSPIDELAGLPHPKPKHSSTREHSMEFRYGRIGSVSTGSVAERVMMFEKCPPVKQTQQPLSAPQTPAEPPANTPQGFSGAFRNAQNRSPVPDTAQKSQTVVDHKSAAVSSSLDVSKRSTVVQKPSTSESASSRKPVPDNSTLLNAAATFSTDTSPSRSKQASSAASTSATTTSHSVQQQQSSRKTLSEEPLPSATPKSANKTPVNGSSSSSQDVLPSTVTVRQKQTPSSSKKYLPDVTDVLSPLSPLSPLTFDVPPKDSTIENLPQNASPSAAKILRVTPQNQVPHSAAVKEPKKPVSVDSKPKEVIPTFFYKYGRPVPATEVLSSIASVNEVFSKLEDGKAKESDMTAIMNAADLPLYWKKPLFLKCGGGRSGAYITHDDFSHTWKSLTKIRHDEASRFIALLASCPSQDYLIPEDFEPLVQDIVDTHPGLSFLREAKEFHLRYVHTVIARIWFSSSLPWRERLEIKDLRNSKFLKTLRLLQDEDDINQITDYFSYEHFYVIYCKFWELDKDHDLIINMQDLSRHADYALSSRIIKRIFSGLVNCDHLARFCLRDKEQRKAKMTYPEFAWFLMAEEDKRQPTSIEYWFRCLDRDGDGILSFDEMKYFYDEQVTKMAALGMETLPFTDVLCQILDMVKPEEENKIRLKDLKRCKMSPFVFDVLFNVDKYLEHEQRDPNASFKAEVCEEVSDWDRYAAEEYEMLVQEEAVPPEAEINYEDDEDEARVTAATKSLDDMNLSKSLGSGSQLHSLSQFVTSTISGSKEI